MLTFQRHPNGKTTVELSNMSIDIVGDLELHVSDQMTTIVNKVVHIYGGLMPVGNVMTVFQIINMITQHMDHNLDSPIEKELALNIIEQLHNIKYPCTMIA